MIKIIDECVYCDAPCIGNSCMYRNVLHMTCDCCGQDVEELYEYSSIQYCSECILDNFRKIDPEDFFRDCE